MLGAASMALVPKCINTGSSLIQVPMLLNIVGRDARRAGMVWWRWLCRCGSGGGRSRCCIAHAGSHAVLPAHLPHEQGGACGCRDAVEHIDGKQSRRS
eukprot:6181492-Pleurochrysis_carterae.AAC.2